MATTVPTDSVSSDYAYGEDDKANIGLAWYRDLPDVSDCVYMDRSNSLGDFIGNHCSYPFMVWYCVTDPGHGFQCGGSPSVPVLTIVGAHDKSSTLKGRIYHWFACGSPDVDVHLFKSNSRWDGQHVRGRCSVD